MKENKVSLNIIIFVSALFLFNPGTLFNNNLLAAKSSSSKSPLQKKGVSSGKTTDKSKEKEDIEASKNKKTEKSYYPELSLLSYYSVPMADLVGQIDRGMGVRINYSLDSLSLLGLNLGVSGLNSRVGFNTGMHSFSKTTDEYHSKLNLFPLIPFFELNYVFSFGIRLYTRAGYGFTYVTVEKQYTVSVLDNQKVNTDKLSGHAMDQTIEYTVGAFYKHSKFPHLAYYIEAGYMMVAESTRAHFIHYALGLSYHFYR